MFADGPILDFLSGFLLQFSMGVARYPQGQKSFDASFNLCGSFQSVRFHQQYDLPHYHRHEKDVTNFIVYIHYTSLIPTFRALLHMDTEHTNSVCISLLSRLGHEG